MVPADTEASPVLLTAAATYGRTSPVFLVTAKDVLLIETHENIEPGYES